MNAVVQYLLSVIAASMICCIVNSLWRKSNVFTAIGKLLTGLFLALTVIEPLVDIEISQIFAFTKGYSQEADAIVNQAQMQALQERSDIIKQQAVAYILDKAESLGAELTIEITLSGDDMALPCAVKLEGNTSPYVKAQLSRLITNELGIPEEAQKWIG